MPFSLKPLALAACACLAFLTACGDEADTIADSGSDADGASIVGREFWSTDVVIDGEPAELVEGTRITMRFDETSISAGAGCNNLFADYTLDGDTLVASGVGSTEMGCDPERHAQDEFVARLLTASPTITLSGDTMTISTETESVRFVDEAVANPDVAFEGAVWEVTGFFDEVAAWAHAVDRPATISYLDGVLTVDDECGIVTIQAVETEPEKFSLTTPISWPACDGEMPAATADLRTALDVGLLEASIEGQNLRLDSDGGIGVTATATS